MKETKNWLKIAEKKAQFDLTFLRQQIRALDAFQLINHLPEITQQRRLVSTEIKSVRKELREQRFKAVLRRDLPAEKYRPSPSQKTDSAEVISFKTTTAADHRELLLVS